MPVSLMPTSASSRRAFIGTAAGALILPLAPSVGANAASTPARPARREKPAPSLETLTDMLQRLPGHLATTDDPTILFTYVDLEAQLSALEIPPFTGWGGSAEQDRAYVDATSMLPLGNVNAFLFSRDEEFVSGIGFNPMASRQVFQAGLAHGLAMCFRGGFDPETIHEAWEAVGYVPMALSTGQTAWTNGPDGHFSPDNPIQRRAVGTMNNAAVLDDEWLVFTRSFATLDDIAAFVDTTTADSLFAHPGVRDAVAALNDQTIAAVAISGDLLTPEETFPEGSPLPESLATADDAFGPLPAASLLLMAVTSGIRALIDGEDIAVLADVIVQARLTMTSADDAAIAAEVIPQRWESLGSEITKGPYTAMLEVTQAAGVGEVAGIDFAITGPPSFWYRFIDQRDWLPFVTTGP